LQVPALKNEQSVTDELFELASAPPGKRCVLESEMAKKSLKQLFFREKPEISVSNEIGEIKIYLPTITNKLDPLYYEFLKQL
jgi:hypothetical protein